LRHRRGAYHVAYQPGGRLLVSAGSDDRAQLWDVTLGRAVGPPLRHGDLIRLAEFDRAGGRLLTCCLDGTPRLWAVPTSMRGDSADLARWAERVTGKTLDEAGAIRLLEGEAWRGRGDAQARR